MRIKLLIFAFLLPMFVMAQAETKQPKKVAVWETKCIDKSISPFQSTMVRGGMETAVGNAYGYEVYDRSAFDAIMKEQKFQRSGAVSDSEIKRMGEMAGVQYIIVPEATASGGEFYILVKMLDVETGKFGAVYEELCGPSGMEIKKACSQLGIRLFGEATMSGLNVSSRSQSSIDNNSIANTQSSTVANNQKGIEWRIGYVNSREIIILMPEYSKAKEEIQNLCNQYESDLKSMQEDFEKKYDAFDKDKASLSENIKQRRVQELQDLDQKIRQTHQDNMKALQQAQQKKMQAITSKVIEAIKEYSIKKNLLYVFDSESSVTINKEIIVDLTENIKYYLGLRGTDVNVTQSKTPNKIGFVRSEDILSLMNITAYSDSITRQNASRKVVKATEIAVSKYGLSLAFDTQSGIPFINDSFVCDITSIVENELNLTNKTPIIPNKYINNAVFAHVNSSEIISAMPEFIKARTDIETLTNLYEANLKQMQDEYQNKIETFEKNKATLPDNIKQGIEQELEQFYHKIQQTYLDNQQALNQIQQEKMQTITTKVLSAIKSVAQEGSYAIVMDTSSGIPYLSTILSTDITIQVKKKLGVIR